MNYGKAKGLMVKTFADYTNGDIEEKLNNFFRNNPSIIVLDIKYFNGYSVVSSDDSDTYGRETAILIYRVRSETIG